MHIVEGHYELDNPTNCEWIAKYNKLVRDVKSGALKFAESEKLTFHHIIPRSISPEISGDPMNHLWVPFAEHLDLHYYMWKHNPEYAAQLWFGCVYGRKHKLWDLPGGDQEYMQLRQDLALSRKAKVKRLQDRVKGQTKCTAM